MDLDLAMYNVLQSEGDKIGKYFEVIKEIKAKITDNANVKEFIFLFFVVIAEHNANHIHPKKLDSFVDF